MSGLQSKSGSGATFTNYVDPSTNRLSFGNYCYDPDGNLVSDQNGGGCGNPSYAYDVANRMVSAKMTGGTETYAYDSGNKRISKISASGAQTIYIYGAFGEKLAVAPSGGTPCRPSTPKPLRKHPKNTRSSASTHLPGSPSDSTPKSSEPSRYPACAAWGRLPEAADVSRPLSRPSTD